MKSWRQVIRPYDINNPSESSISGGVEVKAEIVGDDKMSTISKNPSDDLPNQEKNQCWTVYW